MSWPCGVVVSARVSLSERKLQRPFEIALSDCPSTAEDEAQNWKAPANAGPFAQTARRQIHDRHGKPAPLGSFRPPVSQASGVRCPSPPAKKKWGATDAIWSANAVATDRVTQLVQLCTLEVQTDLSIPERLSHIQVVCGGTVEGFLRARSMTPSQTAAPRSPRRRNANQTGFGFCSLLINGAPFLRTAKVPVENRLHPLLALAMPRIG
jgi:hypothetical protein